VRHIFFGPSRAALVNHPGK